MTYYWACVGQWAVPTASCHEWGEGTTSAPQNHTKQTGHPTVTTNNEALARRLAEDG